MARDPRQEVNREILFTGFPNYLVFRIMKEILSNEPDAAVSLVILERFKEKSKQILKGLGKLKKRVRVYTGDVASLDLGLSGEEYKELISRTTHIHHAAAVYHVGAGRSITYETNIHGTRNVLRFAHECARLERMFHYSSVFVSGTRTGLIMENELEKVHRFKNYNERTRYKAEKMVRNAKEDLPITIFRLGIIVGDSRTGEIHKFEGPYMFMKILLTTEFNMPFFMPGSCSAPAHIAPVDYVSDAIYHISNNPESTGKAFHIIDPYPVTSRTVMDKVCSYLGKNTPVYGIPKMLYKTLFRIPGMENFAGVPKEIFDYFNHEVQYDCRETLNMLDGTGITCPGFDEYFTMGIEFAERLLKEKIEKREEALISDPFDTV